jgi:phytoene dehydrogenase-like protein
MLGKRTVADLLRVGPMCIADWLDEYFTSDLLKASLALPAVLGDVTGPWSPGTAANLLLHEALADKSPVGGGSALAKALESAARNYGAEFKLDSEVTSIKVSGGAVSSVRLREGQEIRCASVAASCDPKQVFQKLLEPSAISAQVDTRIRHYRTRGTAAKVIFAVKGKVSFACRPGQTISRARTAASMVEIERAFDPVKYGQFSERPVLDVSVPTVELPHLAPVGQSVVSALVSFAPIDLRAGWSDYQKEILRDRTASILEEYIPGFKSQVIASEVLSPACLEKRYLLSGGHVHHGERAIDQILVRPIPEAASYATPIKGLYLSGKGSHGGGFLHGAPGMIAAKEMIRTAPKAGAMVSVPEKVGAKAWEQGPATESAKA